MNFGSLNQFKQFLEIGKGTLNRKHALDQKHSSGLAHGAKPGCPAWPTQRRGPRHCGLPGPGCYWPGPRGAATAWCEALMGATLARGVRARCDTRLSRR
jgi:hypothetical protein